MYVLLKYSSIDNSEVLGTVKFKELIIFSLELSLSVIIIANTLIFSDMSFVEMEIDFKSIGGH
jgi:hypothetical protein